jgi:hypothetical protein
LRPLQLNKRFPPSTAPLRNPLSTPIKAVVYTGFAVYTDSLRPFRQECLEENWLTSLEDAKMKIEAWRKDYNDRKWSAPPAQTKESICS